MKCSEEASIAVNFFRKLPPEVKVEIDEYFLSKLSDDTQAALLKNDRLLAEVFKMTPELAEYYTKYAEDCDYFRILGFWEEISIVLLDIFKLTDYYKRYPEYLV